jgi:hypothetical protein
VGGGGSGGCYRGAKRGVRGCQEACRGLMVLALGGPKPDFPLGDRSFDQNT